MDSSLCCAVELFERLLVLDPATRESRLSNVPAEVETQVRALLTGAAKCGVLDGPTPQLAAGTTSCQTIFNPKAQIGPFRIVAPIGIGGMGEVFLAHRQDSAFTQRVAIKLLRVDSMPNIAAFERERRLLAQVSHPNIARLIDGGITAEGRPWMAMDYIDGEPLDRWCASHNPTLDMRLNIFAQISDAVSCAHANLIIHRDIKPSNIMIDAGGRAHLLDFGVAKLLGDSADTVTQTQALLTPDYAAPEQLGGGPITIATDVYALGALLFELLTGRRPWQSSGSLPAYVRRVVTEEPPLSSKAAAALANPPVPVARLKGDLDAIIRKAMRKEPALRYATVSALREDLERARALRPVRARHGSRRYTLGRFARRNYLPIVATTAMLIAIFGGATAFAIQAHRTAVERDRALAEVQRSDAIINMLSLMLRIDSASTRIGTKPSLDRSAAQMLARLDGSARSGQAVSAMADLFVSMNNAKAAHALYQGAVEGGVARDSPIWAARLRTGLASTENITNHGKDIPDMMD